MIPPKSKDSAVSVCITSMMCSRRWTSECAENPAPNGMREDSFPRSGNRTTLRQSPNSGLEKRPALSPSCTPSNQPGCELSAESPDGENSVILSRVLQGGAVRTARSSISLPTGASVFSYRRIRSNDLFLKGLLALSESVPRAVMIT